MLKVPAIDIAEVGAGGGSIARVDAGGLLRVGPESAGAMPGPACYGSRQYASRPSPTPTWSCWVTSIPGPGRRHAARSTARSGEAAICATSSPSGLGIDAVHAAHGIRAVANVSAWRAPSAPSPSSAAGSARSGVDGLRRQWRPAPRRRCGARLGIRASSSPACSGVFSAVGMLAADVEHTIRPPGAAARSTESGIATVQAMIAEAHGERVDARIGRRRLSSRRRCNFAFAADLRYAGQSSELTVRFGAGAFRRGQRCAAAEFDATLYAETFGYRNGRAGRTGECCA